MQRIPENGMGSWIGEPSYRREEQKHPPHPTDEKKYENLLRYKAEKAGCHKK